MLHHLAPGAGLALASLLWAQDPVHVALDSALRLDSGYRSAPAGSQVLLWSQVVTLGGEVVQLHCHASHLDGDAELRFVPLLRPTWSQRHDAHSLLDYAGWTCQLLGPAVRVELWSGTGGGRSRVAIDRGRSTSYTAGGEDSLCDGTDDRSLGSDPRVGRFGSGCTAWLFSEYALTTAGHCTNTGSTAGVLVHFRVPLSTATGALQPAHPNDQYALSPFLQYLDQGIGQDWAVVAAVRNSNTQLFPGQAQGGWFGIAPPPAPGGPVRVTGHGTVDGVVVSPTWNQVQTTHSGPSVATTTPDAVAYRVDTTGGNSGSPIQLEPGGPVIGVHTHGGCLNGSGANFGTASTRTDWAAARQAALALHVVGGFRTFGSGCGGSYVPTLSFGGVPELGRVFSVRVGGINPQPGLPGVLVIGFSDQQSSLGGLPMPLAPFGLHGCSLFVSNEASDGMLASSGYAVRSYLVPNQPPWLGLSLFYQYIGLDPSSGNPAGAAASNAGAAHFGN